jgi:hypothetical protein
MERLCHCLRRPAAIALALVCAACASPPPARPSTPSQHQPPAITSATPSASVAGQPVRVAVIVMENRAFQSVIGLPYISSLATSSTVLSNYRASAHPSLPNYLALTSGTTWGIADDGYHVLPEQDVGDQLTSAGIPWHAYMEGMGVDCRQNGGRYAVKHDPFAYYGGRCPSAVVPLTHLGTDLATTSPPRFIWITPDLCNDMHDCSSAVGDAWLRRTVPAILASPAMSNGVLFVTWDENDGGGSNQVLTLVLGARRPLAPSTPYSHPALLATVEDLLGLSRLPATAGVAAIALR